MVELMWSTENAAPDKQEFGVFFRLLYYDFEVVDICIKFYIEPKTLEPVFRRTKSIIVF